MDRQKDLEADIYSIRVRDSRSSEKIVTVIVHCLLVSPS